MAHTILTPEDIKKIAHLARLPLSDDEVEIYTKQLSSVLDYFKKLDEVDTADVEPTYQSVPGENRFQEMAEDAENIPFDDVLKNASEKQDRYVVTKGVFEE